MCPLRYLVALFSLLLLLWSMAGLFISGDSPNQLQKKDRSWGRFIAALFTGEILYDWWGGKKTPESIAEHVDARREAQAPAAADAK